MKKIKNFIWRINERNTLTRNFSFKNPIIFFLCALILVNATSTLAAQNVFDPIYGAITPLFEKMANTLQLQAYRLFFALASVQFFITMYGELTKGGGEIEAVFGKLIKTFVWMAFCLWLMSDHHASNFIRNTVQYFINNSIGFATTKSVEFSAAGVIKTGFEAVLSMVDMYKNILDASTNGGGSVIYSLTSGFQIQSLIALLFSVLMFLLTINIVLAITIYMCIKVFMIKIEALMIVMLLPLNLALMGMNALRDQGFAPFKHMLALIYRILIMAVVVGGMVEISDVINKYVTEVLKDPAAHTNFMELTLAAAIGYVILGYMAFKADVIASSLASGSSSLGSQSDSAMAAGIGAALGAAVAATGIGAAVTGASKLGDMMKTGAISNASSGGNGITPDPAPVKPAGNSSVGTSSSSSMPPKPPSGGDSSSTANTQSNSSSNNNQSSSQTGGGAPTPVGSQGSNSSSSSNDNQSSSQTGGDVPSELGSGADAGVGVPVSDIDKPKDNPPKPPPKEDKPKGMFDQIKEHAGKANSNIAKQDQGTTVSINVNDHN